MPMIFVELSVITHAEEGIVEGGGADEVELFDLKYFLLTNSQKTRGSKATNSLTGLVRY